MSPEGGPLDGSEVTARNWQDPPFNRWAYWHVREFLPTYRVSRGVGPARVLSRAAARADLLAIGLTRADGSAGTVADVLAGTFTDAYAVLQDGELAAEWYGPEGDPGRLHALMSVSKSVVGLAAVATRGPISTAAFRAFSLALTVRMLRSAGQRISAARETL